MRLGSQRARRRSTLYLQISRWQFGADSSIILEFTALRVEMVRFYCSRQPLILLWWIVPTSVKLDKLPL